MTDEIRVVEEKPRRTAGWPFGGRLYYGWVLVVTLGITETITWGILYYGFTVLMPSIERDMGWSRGEMSAAFSLGMLVSGACAAPVGRWLDFRGPRVLMTGGSVAAVLLLLAWSRIETLPQFFLLWVLIGATMATVLYEPAFAVVTAWFERQRTRALTAVTLMAGLASTIFMPIESWLVEWLGWRQALVWLALFLALTTIPAHALLLRRRPEDLGLHLDGDASPRTPAASARKPTTSVSAALRDPAFRWLAIAFGLSTVCNIAIHTHLVAYLRDRGFEPGLAATATGMVGAMQVFGRIVLGLLGNRFSLRTTTAVVLGVQPVSFLVLLLVPSTFGVFAFILLFGSVKGMMTLIRPALVAEIFGRARYASIAGALAACVIGATALAPVSAGAAYDLLGRYEPLITVFVLLGILASAAALMVRPPRG